MNLSGAASPCVFCDLEAGRIPGRIIYRDKATLAFFSLDQEVRGHAIVAPPEHVATWPELAEELVHRVFLATQEVSRRLCSALGAEAVNVLFAGGPAAQQSVGHFHVHVLPRWRGDGLDAWPRLPGYQGDVEADFRAVAAAGRSDGWGDATGKPPAR
jgi:histidine triad (HIT) family protein